MLNKAILMGRLTRDPELRNTQTGLPVTSFSIAVNRRFTKQGEQPVTDFINIVAWRNTAEFVNKYFRKGMQVVVSGAIQTRSWQDQNGNTRREFEIVADDVYFADSKRETANNDDQRPALSGFDSEPSNVGNGSFEEIEEDGDLPF